MVAADPIPPSDPTELLDPASIDGDHPDPVTLTEPIHDEQGLLRWGSVVEPARP